MQGVKRDRCLWNRGQHGCMDLIEKRTSHDMTVPTDCVFFEAGVMPYISISYAIRSAA